jgi:hypothetical protein
VWPLGPCKKTSVSAHSYVWFSFIQLSEHPNWHQGPTPKSTYGLRTNAYKKVRGPRSTSRSMLMLFTRASPRIKKQEPPDRHPILFLYFLHTQHRVQKARGSQSMSYSIFILFIRVVRRSPIDDHYTFYTQSSSAYKKQGASIHLSYNTSQVSSKIISVQFYNFMKVYCRTQKSYYIRV